MKHSFSSVLLLASICFCCSCTGGKKKVDEPPITVVPIEELPDIIEVHGTVGDGSSMNVLQLIEPDGDTLDILTPNQMVMGGLIVGNQIDVVYSLVDENPVAQLAVNTTALQHLWSQQAADGHLQSLELDSRGRASTYGMNIDYERWNVQDGFLLLHSPRKPGEERPAQVDTFQILMLTEDSLVLMAPNAPMASAFYRDN
jgi:hypothetical protein